MQLMMNGLPEYFGEAEIREMIAGFGEIERIELVIDIVSGISKGMALVEMPVDSEGQDAVGSLDGSEVGGKKIHVWRMHRTMPGEMTYREWFCDHAPEVLAEIGVKPGLTVLDFGCGPGIFSFAAAEIVGPQGKLFALDVRQEALDRIKQGAAERGYSNISTILYDRSTKSVPLDDASVDIVLLFDVVHDIGERNELLTELHRLLRPGGILSVYPMHVGTDAFLEIIGPTGLFTERDRCPAPGFSSVSEIINFVRG